MLLFVLKTALLLSIVTAALVLVLAFTLRWDWISADRIDFVNTCIKALTACLGGFLFARSVHRGAWTAAGLCAVLYMLLSFVVFAICSGSFSPSVGQAIDLLMVFTCAACSEILFRYLFERREMRSK